MAEIAIIIGRLNLSSIVGICFIISVVGCGSMIWFMIKPACNIPYNIGVKVDDT